MKKEKMEAYDNALCLYCRQSALLEHFKMSEEAGIKISKREIERAKKHLVKAKDDLLHVKKALGFDDEVEFAKKPLYSNKGFELVNHRLTGNLSNVVSTLESWRCVSEITKKNHFKYEQATLVLSHYYMQTNQYVHMRGAWRVISRNVLIRIIDKSKDIISKYKEWKEKAA